MELVVAAWTAKAWLALDVPGPQTKNQKAEGRARKGLREPQTGFANVTSQFPNTLCCRMTLGTRRTALILPDIATTYVRLNHQGGGSQPTGAKNTQGSGRKAERFHQQVLARNLRLISKEAVRY